MRRKYSPMTDSCLTRLQTMIDAREAEGELFDFYNGDRIFTPQEVAYVLDTSTTTVASLVKTNRLKAKTFGKVIRFVETDVLAFIGAKYEAA